MPNVTYLPLPWETKVKCWKDNILLVYWELKSIPEVYDTIYSDASTKGWGAHDKNHIINGRWTGGESRLHINVLELLPENLQSSPYCHCKLG